MKLEELVRHLDGCSADAVIYARRPWSPSSECEAVAGLIAVPSSIDERGLVHFLEVHLARKVLSLVAERLPTHDKRVSLLIYYAEHDAYPDWVYQ